MSAPLPLCDATLGELATRIDVPRYDRGALRPGVVHMSVGAFHRAHQAVYFDDLARIGERDWGIVGVALRRPRLRTALRPQNDLYTVVSRRPERDEARVVGAITSHLAAPEDVDAVVEALCDERVALVTLTITADGYGGASSAIDLLVRALGRRRRAGVPPFTVLSCDNLPGNGDRARAAAVALAGERDPGLARWIEELVAFPNGMVDRITPRTTVADREELAREFGVLDRWPVMTEAYSQWILEDRFCNRRPPLERVGVEFVEDVTPYALLKTRLLNASHCAIGFLGSLAGLRRAHEVMDDPALGPYVAALMAEVGPLLPAAPGVDLPSYRAVLLDRLANPKIGDDLARLCRAGTSKVASHVVPSLLAARERGAECALLTLAVAGWVKHLQGRDELGRDLLADDQLAPSLRAAAGAAGSDPRPLLAQCPGMATLATDHVFVAALRRTLGELERGGARAAASSCRDREAVAA